MILKNPEFIFRPSTLDAYVFGFLAPLYKVRFPKVQLQEHLKQLSNLCRFCDDILNTYFRLSLGGKVASLQLIFVCKEDLQIFLRTHKQDSLLIKEVCVLSLKACLYIALQKVAFLQLYFYSHMLVLI